jgi:hypothetical protein
MDVRVIAVLFAASCGFDSSGVGAPGGNTSAPMDETSSSSTSTSTSTSSDSNASSTSADPDTSTTDLANPSDCNGVPMPMPPTALGPIDEITVSGVAFSGSGSNLVHVQAGDTVVLELHYEVASCQCERCMTQGVLGLVNDDWRACFYNAVPACAGAAGEAMIAVEAPRAPGFYPLSVWRTWEFACNADAGAPDPDRAIAGLCVDAG